MFGRLVYLSSLRDSNSGRYEHHGLALVFGEEQCHKALRESHSRAFAEWLCFTLEHQQADLGLYLSGLPGHRRTVLDTWMRLAPYRNLMPTGSRRVEKQLYLEDLERLLGLLRAEYGVGADPDA